MTYHGFALNVTCELEPFRWFVPCGLNGVAMTSIAQVKPAAADMSRVARQVAETFCTACRLEGYWPSAAEVVALASAAGRSYDPLRQEVRYE